MTPTAFRDPNLSAMEVPMNATEIRKALAESNDKHLRALSETLGDDELVRLREMVLSGEAEEARKGA